MLISLTLQNFKKHAHLHVDFTEGTNGIYGPNYKGKTTLLYGILFALGGSSHVPGNRLHRIGTDERMLVTLVMQIGAHTYKVVRGKTAANLYDGEELIAASASAVTSKIEELVGMSVKQWKELHYAKQKNAHSLLRYSATNLHQLMRRLVGAEELDAIQGRLKLMATREQGVVDAFAFDETELADLQVRREGLEAALADLQRRVEPDRRMLAELQAELDSVRSRIDELQAQQTSMQEWVAASDAAAERVRTLQQSLESAQAELEKRRSLRDSAAAAAARFDGFSPQKARKLVLEIEGNVRDRRLSQERVEALREASRTADHKVEVAKLNVEQAAKKLDEALAGKTMAELSAELEAARTRSAELRAAWQSLVSAAEGAVCPTCQQPISDHDPEALQREAEAALKESEGYRTGPLADAQSCMTLAKTLHDARVKLDVELQAAEQAAEQAEKRYEDEHRKFEELSKEGALLASDPMLQGRSPKELSEMASECALALQAADSAETELGDAEERVQRVTANLEKAQQAVPTDLEEVRAKLADVRDNLTFNRGKVEGLRQRMAEFERSVKGLDVQVASAQAEINAASIRLQVLTANREKHDKAAKRLAKIQHLQKYLKQNAETYMNKAWSSFMVHASRFANLCTGGDIERLDRTEDGAFSFTEDGQEMQLEEASGAQEAIIGLAVQVALASAAPCHLNVMLLDEPTADMDADRSLATIAALGALGQQVIFVSHHQTDNAVCSNAITL